MKIPLVLLVIFFIVTTARPQEIFLGKSKKQIIDSLAKLHYFPLRLGEAVMPGPKSPIVIFRANADSDLSRENAGLLTFKYDNPDYYDTKTFTVNNGDTTGYVSSDTTHLSLLNFYMKNDTCFRFFEDLDQRQLPKMLQYLKLTYKKIDDNHWIDNTGTYEAKLDDKNNGTSLPGGIYIIKFKKVGSIQYMLARYPDPY